MALNKTEGKHAGEFIASLGNGTYSKENVTLISGQNLVAGSVLGKITASGKYTMVAPGASDGSQTAVAILWDNVDASGGDTKCVIVAREAEVNKDDLNFASLNGGQITTAISQLSTVGIIVRSSV